MSPPVHLYTLTGNLLAERTLEFDDWAVGRTQRAARESFHARGKGVNVSNMLHRLGAANTALLFAGGAPGAECESWLRQRGIDHRIFPTVAPSRTGTVIWSRTRAETTFLGPDCAPDAAAVRACAAFIGQLPPGQILALCGSFPGWSGPDFDPLRDALRQWSARGRLIADAYGPPLPWLAQLPLDLIKINRAEFDSFAPPSGPDDDIIARLARTRPALPVRNWILTDGPGTICLAAETGGIRTFHPPAITEVSPTGSGDVFLACLLQAHYLRGKPLADAIAWAIPYASANAAHPGVADFDLPAAG